MMTPIYPTVVEACLLMIKVSEHARINRRGRGLDPPLEKHVAIGFRRNTGMDPPREAMVASQGRSVPL